MDSFLQDVERRGLRMAEIATGNRDDALEIVQDSMMGLAQRYSERPSAEWKPLFYRILQSRINDFHRRRMVRRRVMVVVKWVQGEEGEAPLDPIESAPGPEQLNPEQAVQQDVATKAMLQAIEQLPRRQQQAFLLRAWEGFSVQETAKVMGCRQGSVKTHYSRAVRNLRIKLEDVKP